ncbi:sugar-binding protein [Oscillospiraceae bacterium MB08-C2-2]|nr:sugar-binding protein [Oscillospiraceae bacterium MB08-C2-2]
MNTKRIISLILVLVLAIPLNLFGGIIAFAADAKTVTGSSDDYNGAEMWLRYVLVDDNDLLQSYKNTIKSIIVPEENAAALYKFSETDLFYESYGYKGLQQPAGSTEVIPQTTLEAARIELDQAFEGLLGSKIPKATKVSDGAVIVGTPATSDIIAGLNLDSALGEVGDEGYIIKSLSVSGSKVTVIAGNTEIGALYGTYAFLRLIQTQESISDLNISDFPKVNHRRINSWEKERFYAGNNVGTNYDKGGLNGESGFLFNFDLSLSSSTGGNVAHSNKNAGAVILPNILDRYVVAARALASVGINEFNLNNVNSNSAWITEYVIRQEAALADLLRPYGIKLCLSVNYANPVLALCNQTTGGTTSTGVTYWADETTRIGTAANSTTMDINNKDYEQWWYDKTVQIQKKIPDFAGYTVKANSEGQAGPQSYGNTHAEGANHMAAKLGELGVTVFWRSFVYDASVDNDRLNRAYMEFGPADDTEDDRDVSFLDNVFVQTKNGPLDFQSREPFHPMFGRMTNTNQAIELQITMEYLGHSTYMTYLGTMWEEIFKSDTYANGEGTLVGNILDGSAQGQADTAIVGVNNMGNHETVTGHNFLQANTYSFGRQSWNWTLNAEDIADEWTRMTWGNDEETVDTLVNMMMGSREAVVDTQGAYGLLHQQSQSIDTDHYGPGQWDFATQDDWGPAYYNKASKDGIGFRRTIEGRIADFLPVPKEGSVDEKYYPLANQYFPELTEMFSNIETCPEEYLLTFHHVPWDYELENGLTMWENLIYKNQEGVQYATYLRETWENLEGKIDQYRWEHTMKKLISQEFDMARWRDEQIKYWLIVSGRDMPTDTAPLSITIEAGGKEHRGFDLGRAITSWAAADPSQSVPASTTGINAPASGVGTQKYVIYVPYGTTVPTIDNVIPYDQDASFEIIKQAASMSDTAVVKVTKDNYFNSESGESFGSIVQNYTFEFQYDTTLSSISVDGTAMESFAGNKTVYDAYTKNPAPVVSAVASDPAATVVVNQVTKAPGTATITVSNNGAPTTTYKVNLAPPANKKDDFESNILDYKWSWVRENNSNWSLTSVPGAMTITSQAGNLRGSTNTAQNILLQDAPGEGDWIIETKIDFSRAPASNGEQGGIIAYVDDNNYLMTSWKRGSSSNVVEFIREENGTATTFTSSMSDVNNLAAGPNKDKIWLRIEKRGNSYLGYFANDGQTWKPCRIYNSTATNRTPAMTTLRQTPTKVGVVAMNENGTSNTLNASYDYFTITTMGEEIPFGGVIPTNKNALSNLITQTELLVPTDYTPASWALVQTALDAAKLLMADEEATQEAVDAAVLALQQALSTLADTSMVKLKASLAQAKLMSTTDWSEEDKQALKDAIATGQALVDASSTDDEAILAAIAALEAAASAQPIPRYGYVPYGTPELATGVIDPLWDDAKSLPVDRHLTMANGPASGLGKLLWDDQNLYVLAEITDPVLNNSNSNTYQHDSVEIFVDENNSKASSFGNGMGQYRVSFTNQQSFGNTSYSTGFESWAWTTDTGYVVLAKIPFKYYTPAANKEIGFDLQINDAGVSGSRQDVVMWYDTSGSSYNNGSGWGTARLMEKDTVPVDKTNLNAAIAKASGLTEGEYTAESWAVLANALTAAQGVAADTAATQEAVDSAAQTLTQAIEALVKAVEPVDKSALEALIDEAEGLKETDYTAESWAIFANAFAAAKSTAADTAATQEAVDEAVIALQAAVEGLEKAGEPGEEIPVTALKITGSSTVKRNKTAQLTAVITPTNATDKEVVWTSVNPNVAEVDENGLVTATSQTGFAIIQATASNGVTAQFTIRVTA